MTLKTRPPTGRASSPLILLEGEEKAGKTWAAAEFSGCDRVGATYWLELGPEGCADEYGAVPGARYKVLEHEGSWWSIVQTVEEVHTEAARARDTGEPPVVLVIDTMSAEWDLLKDWATGRARNSDRNKEALAKNPDAEVEVSTNYWNDANSRHRRLMRLLLTFPGIAIITARGKDVVAMEKGAPNTKKPRDYAVEAQKSLGFDAKVWVRMFRDRPALVVGCRSVHAGVKPGVDKPKVVRDFSLEWLVFDYLKYDPATAQPRDLQDLVSSDEEAVEAWKREMVKRIGASVDLDDLRGPVWKEVQHRNNSGFLPDDDARAIAEIIAARSEQIKAETQGAAAEPVGGEAA
jgi:hypothetical protein